MRLPSLSARLLVASAIALPIFLGLTSYGLDRAFQRALRLQVLEQLKGQSYLLLGATDWRDQTLRVASPLPEPRYGQLDSGLYARLHEVGGRLLWRSASAELQVLPEAGAPTPPGECDFRTTTGGERALFEYECGLVWEGPDGAELPFQLTVWQDQEPFALQVAGYRASLLRWLGLAAFALLALQLGVLRFGLRPLREVARDLERVEEGEWTRLSEAYPSEIRGLTDNLNQLLASEQGRRERYRNTLADLAHSLKTPLAVLRAGLDTGLDSGALREQLAEQLARMEQIVAHQLGRASRSGAGTAGQRSDVASVIERLVAALRKVYREKAIEFEVDVPAALSLRCEEGDCMEMLGNLLDNACKFGERVVRISATGDPQRVAVVIEDDGPGIARAEREQVLRRGARIDESTPGQGIGLAVAAEIASGYGGRLEILESERGGGRFELTLPA